MLSPQDRCSGCAYTCGAKAHGEVNNRLVGMLAALAGQVFMCHERMGWTPDREGYPQSKKSIATAHTNLILAPKLLHDSPWAKTFISDATESGFPRTLFAEDRAVIGRQPVCAGWKETVRQLKTKGWYGNGNREGRRAANAALKAYDAWDASSGSQKRKDRMEELRAKILALRPFTRGFGLGSIFE